MRGDASIGRLSTVERIIQSVESFRTIARHAESDRKLYATRARNGGSKGLPQTGILGRHAADCVIDAIGAAARAQTSVAGKTRAEICPT